MAEKTLSVTVQDAELNENLKKFQKLLAYFVWHLEYMNGDYTGGQKFCEDDKKTIPDGGKTGRGYDGNTVQTCIKEWELLKDGRVYISVKSAMNSNTGSYTSKDSYLHWASPTADSVSIYAVWEADQHDNKNHITGLYVKDKWGCSDSQNVEVKQLILAKKEENIDNKKKDDAENAKERNKKFEDKSVAEGYFSLQELGIFLNTQSKNSSIDDNLNKFYNAFVDAAQLETKAVLERAKNIIFTGAPGTGKTYLAKQIADLVKAQTGFVQFHPSYDYTDFVEGLRPVMKETEDNNSNDIVFKRKDGIFKAFCEKALERWLLDKGVDKNQLNTFIQSKASNIEKNKYKDEELTQKIKNILLGDQEVKGESDQDKKSSFVFVIDEINRGEISKIFGELFFSVDPGYRGVEGAVKTQYANLQEKPNLFDLVLLALGKIDNGDWGHFFIPKNVYIIGTMNDIDRSVESMDFAFRRRFTFIEIKAKRTQLQILNDVCADNEERDTLVETMNNLNEAISAYEEFSDAYHIGGAYFRHYKDYVGQDNQMDKLWDNHIKGVLIEYLRGRPDCDKRLKELKSNYDKGLFGRIGITEQQLRGYLSKNYKEKSEEIIKEIKGVLREIEQEKNEILQYKVSLMNDKTIAKVIEETKNFIKQTKAKKTEQLNDGVDNINAK